jgi:hypothetical protein
VLLEKLQEKLMALASKALLEVLMAQEKTRLERLVVVALTQMEYPFIGHHRQNYNGL